MGGGGGVLALLLADIVGEQISPSDAKGAVAKKTHGDQKRARGGREKERERKKVGRQTVVINPLQPRFHLASTEAARV